MTTEIKGRFAEEVISLVAANGHTHVSNLSDPKTAELQRENENNSDGGSIAASYGCTLSGRTVTFRTYPTAGGSASLIIKGRL